MNRFGIGIDGIENLALYGVTSLHACRKTTCAGKYKRYFDFRRL
jgi:hypothetical protein